VPNVGPFGDPLLLVGLAVGPTWWVEALGWWRGSPQDAMNRVRQGPSALTRHQP
jgi:hypothetical protein